MIDHSAEELYVLTLLERQEGSDAESIKERLTSGELRIQKKSTVVERVTSTTFFVLAALAAAVVVALLAGMAKNLLLIVW